MNADVRWVEFVMNGHGYRVTWSGRLGGPLTMVEVFVAESGNGLGGSRRGHWRSVRDRCGHEQGTYHRAIDRAISELGRT